MKQIETALPLLPSITQALQRQEQEARSNKELLDAANSFLDKADDLLWDYGQVKLKQHDRNYAYPYREPGNNTTPPTTIYIDRQPIQASIQAVFEKDNTPHIHPDTEKFQLLTLHLQSQDLQSQVQLHFDDKGKIDVTRLPTQEDLKTGITILDLIHERYKAQNLKINSKGYSRY